MGFVGSHLHSRLEGTRPFGIFDDANGEAVFDRREWVEKFALDIHRNVRRRHIVDAHHLEEGKKDTEVGREKATERQTQRMGE